MSFINPMKSGGTAAVFDAYDRMREEAAEKKRQEDAQRRTNFDLPGFGGQQQLAQGLAGDARERQAPTLGPQSEFREGQQDLAGMLGRLARGEDSFSAQQLRANADRNISQQQALAASARPGQGAMAQRMAAQNAGRINQGLAGQQSLAGIAERQAAQGALGSLLGQARGADDQRSYQGAQLGLQQQGISDAASLGYLGQGLQGAMAQQQGGMGYEQNMLQRYLASLGQPSSGEKLLSMAGTGAALLGTLSDERAKKRIKPESKRGELSTFLDGLRPYSYEYKDPTVPGASPGRKVSPMAQRIEGSALGRALVQAGDDGLKRVDYGRMTPILAAGLGQVHERLAKLEGR
jgi:hypothetical protein